MPPHSEGHHHGLTVAHTFIAAACPRWAPPTQLTLAAVLHTLDYARAAWRAIQQRRQRAVRAGLEALLGAVERRPQGQSAPLATNRNPRGLRAERYAPRHAHATGSACAKADPANGLVAPAHGRRPARSPRRQDRRAVRCWPRAAAPSAPERHRPRTRRAARRAAQRRPQHLRRARASGCHRSGEAGACGADDQQFLSRVDSGAPGSCNSAMNPIGHHLDPRQACRALGSASLLDIVIAGIHPGAR